MKAPVTTPKDSFRPELKTCQLLLKTKAKPQIIVPPPQASIYSHPIMATFFTTESISFADIDYKSRTALEALGDTSSPPYNKSKNIACDVFIAGSGPIGTTYARMLVESGFNVVMAEVGDQDSTKRGYHKKNTVGFQKDIDKFVHVIKGALNTVSVPVNQTVVNTLNPSVWRADRPFVRNGMNPEQDPFKNLPAQAVIHTVGGMSTHWTCATPRFHRLERPLLDCDEKKSFQEWERLYAIAEGFIGTGANQFDKSIRHQLVLRSLDDKERKFEHLPLACTRENETFVKWHSAHTIFDLEDTPVKDHPTGKGWFKLLTNTQCKSLCVGGDNTVTDARLHDFKDGNEFLVCANIFIIAAGAIATPQILVNSQLQRFDPDKSQIDVKIQNLGKYITEQTMAFCQVVLHKSLVDKVKADLDIQGTPGREDYKVSCKSGNPANENPDWWNDKVRDHMVNHPDDPLPIPFTDPEPQVTTLFASKEGCNWHTQIHRDAFSYGAVAESIDSRLIVDFRWFGRTEPKLYNQLYFSEKYTDMYGMPQPTFRYSIPEGRTTTEANAMMEDMINVASKIGGFLPGSEPQFMPPGLALHLGGSHRSGFCRADSVVDVDSRVWDFPNLFLGGVGNIPTAFASNPTLTAMGYAIKSCEYITRTFKSRKDTKDTCKPDSELPRRSGRN